MYKVTIVTTILIVVCAHFINAAEYLGNSRKRLNVIISNQGINRLEITKDRILKVIGQQEDYDIDSDSTRGIIFISTNLGDRDVIPMTVITEKGMVQDLNLVINEKFAPVTAVIKVHASPNLENNINEDIEKQVINVLSDIVKGYTKEFSFRNIEEKELENLGFTIDRGTAYSNKYFTIFKYEYFEKPKIVFQFNGALAVAERGNAIYVVYRI